MTRSTPRQVAGAPAIRDVASVANVSFVKAVIARMGELHLSAFAAGLAYGAVFSMMPMLVLLLLMLGLFHADNLVVRAMEQLQGTIPGDIKQLLQKQLLTLTRGQHKELGFSAVLSTLVAIWGASGAMKRVMEALNVVHRADETRPLWRKTLVAIVMSIGAIVLMVAMLCVIVLGSNAAGWVFSVVGLGSTAEAVWAWVRWPVLLVLAWAGIASAYRFAPAARQVGGLLTPGTIFSTVTWVLFSVMFSWYVGSVGNMNATWGSVAGIIVLLMYLQYAGLIILVGAVIDVELFDRDTPSSRLRRWLRMPPTK